MIDSLTHLQKYAYQVLKAGYNVFLTGDGGTGKSHLIRLFIDYCRSSNLNVLVTASTGVAAFNIDGVTLHRAFDIPLGAVVFDKDSYNVDDTIVQSDVIIIEEISMVRLDIFDFVMNKISQANNKRKRVGKPNIQLVLVGDFLQLPPVLLDNERYALNTHYKRDVGAAFAFDSVFWNHFEFKYIILTEIVRQSNKEFITALNKVRVGDKSSIDYLYNNSSKELLDGAITLCGTNSETNSKNKEEINKLSGNLVEYKALIDGPIFESETPAELFLKLKVGARVMTLVNNTDYAYNNGSFGTVLELNDNTIKVKMDSGHTVYLERYTWTIYRYELENTEEYSKQKLTKKEIGTFTQFPLKLAYAITIHKSQGQTYDKVNLSPYCWDCGQLYVALSRVRDLSSLHFNYKPDTKYLVISLNVIAFYNSIVKQANQNVDTTINIRENNKIEIDSDMMHILSKMSTLNKE